MAKKSTIPSRKSASDTKRSKERDKVTLGKIVNLADNVATSAFKGRDIAISIPAHALQHDLEQKARHPSDG
jgi:hypothetical protein